MMIRGMAMLAIGSVFAALFSPGSVTVAAVSTPAVDFARDIQPIFQKSCIKCHGPQKAKHGLRLDNRKDALGITDSGRPMIIAGKPDQSELVERIAANEEHDRMPPAKSGARLSRRDVDLIRLWIQQGAHWSNGKPGK